MADANNEVPWTEEQWNRVQQVVYEEARGARVAGNVLPLYGPLDPDASYVKQEELDDQTVAGKDGLAVSDSDSLKLSTLQVKVYLRGHQMADPDLAGALLAFRRAANMVARLEDEIIFKGQSGPDGHPGLEDAAQPETPLWEILGGQETPGLLQKAIHCKNVVQGPQGPQGENGDAASQLVSAVSDAIGDLERDYHLGPFACILDQNYFNIAQTPTGDTLILPQDRILPFLGGGSLLRTSVLPDNSGLVIALGGAPIDLVVATDSEVNFLQVTTDPWYVFRVKEKIVLRIKEPEAVMAILPGD